MSITILAVAIAGIGGCENSPALITTTKPSSSQIELCRLRLYLVRQSDIQPIGFQHYNAKDDTIWFKFRTSVATLPDLFDSELLMGGQFAAKFEAVTKFKDRYEMPTYKDTAKFVPEWWDPQDQILVGGRINTPDTEIMSIGVSNADGRERPGEPAIVYILLKKV